MGDGPRGRRRCAAPGVPIPPEMLRQLRFGRALDNRQLKATGFRYRYTTRETVLKLREHQRLAPLLGKRNGEGYRYEREVEEFLRYSPSVRAANAAPQPLKNVAAGRQRAPRQARRPSKPRLPAAGPPPSPTTPSSRPRRSSRCCGDLEPADLEAPARARGRRRARP